MRRFAWIAGAVQRQRGHLFPWVPVCLATGIGLYFLLRFEPTGGQLVVCGASTALLLVFASRAIEEFTPVILAISVVLLGILLGAFRAHQVAAPVLGYRYYGAVEGTIVGMDRSGSDKLRLTLKDVLLERTSQAKTPRYVRVSLHGDQEFVDPVPGLRVVLTAHLSPPSGAVEPGGFDFQRHAWFREIGGVGYSRTPVLAIEPPPETLSLFGLRMAMSRHIQSHLGGEVGGFAAAVSTGDRSGIHKSTVEALRASNLAHLLAISGLHLGLLAGFVFAVVRFGLALVPPLVLRVPSKKAAAAVALAASAGYLALSGGNVATQRAFIMAAVALIAVMLDRRALSLRAVALAAIIVMVMRPEAILGPGFQMSFAATTALVAVFGLMRDHDGFGLPRWARPVASVVISSLVAGLATAPIAAAHFNVVAHYGLPANLLAVPVMGIIVVPAAVLAVCLAPVGLEGIGLWAMGAGLEWILSVAHFFAERPNARGFVPGPPAMVIPVFSLGMLVLILWQGKARAVGLVAVGFAATLWVQSERPKILVSDTGGLVGVMTENGRVLSKPRGQGFVALNWLENDGDPVDQTKAAERSGVEAGHLFEVKVGEKRLLHVQGKKASLAFDTCVANEIVVFTHVPEADMPCMALTPQNLRHSGSVAFSQKNGRLEMTTARQISGLRLWNSHFWDQ
ncbi:competence protein ComEC [Shimia gijangensis]|uniref:Competence protein ComEC n=1 Tax=Shimia gijangensis TaxID=1470563 RepID=A0A1M6ES14_9RHOB|nr:ComEC/Rec2 family competence protein [Shimia gijangensis]SHI88292.1 competence protein ComEC [Shimia gijangensis]